MASVVEVISVLAATAGIYCSPDRICPNDRVIDESTYTGTVTEVFTDGTVSVKIDGVSGFYPRNVNELAKATPDNCFENICGGHRVVDEMGYVGTVREVFDNGMVKMYIDGYFGSHFREVKNLKKLK